MTDQAATTYASHSHGVYRKSACGRYLVLKSLGFGCRGPVGHKYVVVDTGGEFKPYRADTMAYVECYLHHQISGLELGPWFGSKAPSWKEHGKASVPAPEWNEIKNG